MPSFSEIIGAIVTFIVLANASGHREWVWKGIAEIKKAALFSVKEDWGCPSVWNKKACISYDASRYR